jgi:hypothetical protein
MWRCNELERTFAPVTSIPDLCQQAMCSRRHRALVVVAARRLGGDPEDAREEEAFLLMLVDGNEQAVLEQVNALRGEV